MCMITSNTSVWQLRQIRQIWALTYPYDRPNQYCYCRHSLYKRKRIQCNTYKTNRRAIAVLFSTLTFVSCMYLGKFVSCLELHFVGHASKRIGYLTGAGGFRLWSWSSDDRVFNWSQVVPQNRVFCRSRTSGNRYGLGSGTDACRYPVLLKEWNRGSDSQFGTTQAYWWVNFNWDRETANIGLDRSVGRVPARTVLARGVSGCLGVFWTPYFICH